MFEKLYIALINILLLIYFNIDQYCLLETNTSDTVIAVVFFQQSLNSKQHSVLYFSKSIALAEINYLIYNKEMLVIVQAFEYQQSELESTDYLVEVLTDHKALEYFISTKALSARQACQAEILSWYNFKILYCPGSANTADPLTWMDTDTTDLNCVKDFAWKQQLLETSCLDLKIL